MAGASDSLHESLDKLSSKTLDMHRALVSLQEELEAVDWYRQRADGCSDSELREILLHNMREEMEHAAMVLEWLRRNDADMAENLRTYLFTSAPVTEVEEATMGGEAGEDESSTGGSTIGSLKGES
jgi:ferritin-like protein